MKNRFNLNEEEKKHIKGLHNINEDAGMDTPGGNPDYFYDEDSVFAKEKGFPDNLENMLNNLSQQDGVEMSKEDIVNELIGIYSYSQDGATDLVNTTLETLITNLGGFKDNINEQSDYAAELGKDGEPTEEDLKKIYSDIKKALGKSRSKNPIYTDDELKMIARYLTFLLYFSRWSTLTYSTVSFLPQCGQCNISKSFASLTFHSSLHFLSEHL